MEHGSWRDVWSKRRVCANSEHGAPSKVLSSFLLVEVERDGRQKVSAGKFLLLFPLCRSMKREVTKTSLHSCGT